MTIRPPAHKSPLCVGRWPDEDEGLSRQTRRRTTGQSPDEEEDEDEVEDEPDDAGAADFASFFSFAVASGLSAPSEADFSFSRLRFAVP